MFGNWFTNKVPRATGTSGHQQVAPQVEPQLPPLRVSPRAAGTVQELRDLIAAREEEMSRVSAGAASDWPWEDLQDAYVTAKRTIGEDVELWEEFLYAWNYLSGQAGSRTPRQSVLAKFLQRAGAKGGEALVAAYSEAFRDEMGSSFRDRYLHRDGVWTREELLREGGCDGYPGPKADQREPYLVVVFGASGSGKTRTSRGILCRYFAKNEWQMPEKFVVVDGGKMRDLSRTWAELQCLRDYISVLRGRPLGGFSDAFKLFSESGLDDMKGAVIDGSKAKKASIVLIATGTGDLRFYSSMLDFVLKERPELMPTWTSVKTIQKAGYRIGAFVVDTAHENVKLQMGSRQLAENKKAGMLGLDSILGLFAKYSLQSVVAPVLTKYKAKLGGPVDNWQFAYEVCLNMLKKIDSKYWASRSNNRKVAPYFLVMRNNWRDEAASPGPRGPGAGRTRRCRHLDEDSADPPRSNESATGQLWVPRRAWQELDLSYVQTWFGGGPREVMRFECRSRVCSCAEKSVPVAGLLAPPA